MNMLKFIKIFILWLLLLLSWCRFFIILGLRPLEKFFYFLHIHGEGIVDDDFVVVLDDGANDIVKGVFDGDVAEHGVVKVVAVGEHAGVIAVVVVVVGGGGG